MPIGNLGTMNVAITATDMASGELADTQSQLKSTAASARQVGMGMATIGAVGTAAIGASVQQFSQFEDQMVEVQKVTGMTDEEISGLGERLKSISSGPMPASSEELGKIAAQAGSIGVRGEDAIARFTTTVQKMAVATRLTSDEAAEQMARISKAFDIPIDKAENLGSTINELSNNTSAWSDEISQALRRVAPAANQMGVSMQEASGMVSTLISRGVPARRAGTKLRRVFQMMATDANKMAEVIGVSTDEMRTRIQNDAVGALEDFIQAAEQSGNASQVISETFGAVGASAVNNLTNIEQMNENIETANKAFKNASSLQDEYAAAIEKTSSNVRNLMDRLENIAITVGGNVAPILNNTLFPAVNGVLESFQNLDSQTKQIISVVGALGSAALLLGGGLLFVAGAAIPTIMTGLSALGTLVGAISLPMIVAAGAVAALGAAIATNFMGIRDHIGSAMNAIWGIAKPVLNALLGLFQSLTSFVLQGIGRQVKGMGKLVKAFKPIQTFLMPLIKGLGTIAITTFYMIVNALSFVADNWHSWTSSIGEMVEGLIEWVSDGFESMVNTAIDAVNKLISGFNTIADKTPKLDKMEKIGEFTMGGSDQRSMSEVLGPSDKEREKLNRGLENFATNLGGAGAGKAVSQFNDAVEGVIPATQAAGNGMIEIGGQLEETAKSIRQRDDITVGDIQSKIDSVMGGSESPDQSAKEQKKQRKELNQIKKLLQGQDGEDGSGTNMNIENLNVESDNIDQLQKQLVNQANRQGVQ